MVRILWVLAISIHPVSRPHAGAEAIRVPDVPKKVKTFF